MRAAAVLVLALMASGVLHAQDLAVYAAGSLREAFGEIAQRWREQGGAPVALTFGASGLLRERIEKGEPAQVFASADTEHPQRLADAGGWGAPVVFARNALCALAQPRVRVTAQTLLSTLLRPDVRVGTSTPRADPAGDYAWAMFQRADRVQPGAYSTLDAKALKLTGGPDAPQPPAGRSIYAWMMENDRADVFLTYCTNAVASQREVPGLQVVQLPPELQVAAAYGVVVREGAPPAARGFAEFLRGRAGQGVLQRLGFGAP